MDTLRRWWKHYVVGALFLLGGLAVYDWTLWWSFDASVQSRIVPTIGLPSATQVIGLKKKIVEHARTFWITESSLAIDMHCEQHLSNGFAFKEDQTKLHWFLVVEASSRGRKAKWEQRLDNGLPEVEGEALEAAGIRVVRANKPQGG